jgi:hypothetical protein
VPRFKSDRAEGIPVRVIAYSPAVHGEGDTGVDVWRREALGWLKVNRDRGIPGIGDELGVYRESLRLKGAYEPLKHPFGYPESQRHA